MRGSPLQELFVLCEHGVDHLIQHVLGRLAEKVRIGIQRFVVLAIEASPMFDKLLAAGPRLDQRHTCSLPGKVDMLSNTWRCAFPDGTAALTFAIGVFRAGCLD